MEAKKIVQKIENFIEKGKLGEIPIGEDTIIVEPGCKSIGINPSVLLVKPSGTIKCLQRNQSGEAYWESIFEEGHE